MEVNISKINNSHISEMIKRHNGSAKSTSNIMDELYHHSAVTAKSKEDILKYSEADSDEKVFAYCFTETTERETTRLFRFKNRIDINILVFSNPYGTESEKSVVQDCIDEYIGNNNYLYSSKEPTDDKLYHSFTFIREDKEIDVCRMEIEILKTACSTKLDREMNSFRKNGYFYSTKIIK